VCRIDRDSRGAVGLDQPCKLHDRAASSIEDHPLDVARVPFDPIHTSANHGYLCCKWHVRSGPTRVDERLNTSRWGRQGSRWARGLLAGVQVDVHGPGALRPLFRLEGHLDALVQQSIAVGPGDRTVMYEHILALIVGRDEAKALFVAEPFDDSGSRVFLRRWSCCERGDCDEQRLRALALEPGARPACSAHPTSPAVAESSGSAGARRRLIVPTSIRWARRAATVTFEGVDAAPGVLLADAGNLVSMRGAPAREGQRCRAAAVISSEQPS